MKLAPLLAQYLYSNKRLDLPGLGTFKLEHPVEFEQESKQSKPVKLEGVSFESNPSLKDSPELIQFISSQTGKIKALAAADLDSHLELAGQFLNIGKPFLLEGIGSIEKLSSGELVFKSGKVMPEAMTDLSRKEISTAPLTEESSTDYKNIFYAEKAKTKWKKPLAVLLLLVGIVFAIWGGYTVYKRTTAKNSKSRLEEKINEPVVKTDTTKNQNNNNTVATDQNTKPPPGNYKFIIETSEKERALSRYNRLKGFGLEVQLETKDSVNFKLFFLLPAAVADTARMIDSLRGIYTPSGNRAYIEN